MAIEKKLLSLIKKNQIKNNLQACILYHILNKRLSLNFFKYIVVKKTFHHIIKIR